MKAPAKRRARAAKRPAKQEVDRFELAMRAINEGVYDWNIADGSTVYSDRVLRSLGLSRRQLRNAADWHQRIHPEDRTRFDAALVAHFKGRTERFECDLRYRAGDGGWRWARQHGVAIRDAKGRAVRMIGSTGDITELKRVEEALKASEERYALATRAATEGIYEWNLESDSLFLSDRAKAFFAVAGEALTPAAWNARVHGEDFQGYRDAIVAFFKGGKPVFEHEYRIRDAAGGYAWVRDRAIAVRDPAGRVTRLVGALTDITQRRRAEFEVRRAHQSTTEALARQTATAEILKAIAASPTDVRPVLEALARHAGELCGAAYVNVLLEEESMLRTMAVYSAAGGPPADTAFAMRPLPTTVNGRAFVERRPVHVPDFMAVAASQYPDSLEFHRRFGFRTILGVPMLRGDTAIGTISIWRREVRPFSAEEVALIETFAAQAVIAIENVRLFNETKEALEQQTASSEILRVISSSPADLAPVFDAILGGAMQLCEAHLGTLNLYDGEWLHTVAQRGGNPQFAKWLLERGAIKPDGGMVHQAITERRGVQIADAREAPGYREGKPNISKFVDLGAVRTFLAVPLLKDSAVIGIIGIYRPEVRRFTEKQIALVSMFANQAVIAIENARLFNETKEALKRQTATAEILRVIASSPTDVQPVLDAIAERAAVLCGAPNANVLLKDGDVLRTLAGFYRDIGGEAPDRTTTVPLRRDAVNGRAFLDRKVVHHADALPLLETEYPESREHVRRFGIRSQLVVPLIREGDALGTISIWRREARLFSDDELALVQTFADQAVIAIENARLFNETREALERQTATSELLKVIGQSTSDLQPVFDTLAQNAVKVCHAAQAFIFRFDGQFLRVVATCNVSPELRRFFADNPVAPGRATVAGRAAAEGRTIHVHDMRADPEYRWTAHRVDPIRTVLTVPILRGRDVVGVIGVNRPDVRPFGEHEIELLESFASQAMIAIENVRLFNETREALERQTATAEILKVIANSPADVQPVFDAIVAAALKLCAATSANAVTFDGELIHVAAVAEAGASATEALGRHFGTYPKRPSRDTANTRAILTRQVVAIPDVMEDADYAAKATAVAAGYRSIVSVPLMRGLNPIGALTVARPEPGHFPEGKLALLKTFADQAAIAIENARLFNETKEALELQTATTEVLRVISGTLADPQPVFDAIAQSAARVFDAPHTAVSLVDGDLLRLKATAGRDDPRRPTLIPFDRTSTSGCALLDKVIVDVPDTEAAGAPLFAQDASRAMAFRAIASAPMLREGAAIGAITVARAQPGALSDKRRQLLQTFADQAVIAIENARLFNETKEAFERQKASAEILGTISSSIADTEPVFEKILESCERLFAGRTVGINVLGEDQMIHLGAYRGPGRGAFEKVFPLPIDANSGSGLAIAERRVVHIPDSEADGVPEAARRGNRARGNRASLYAPMISRDKAIGVIWVARELPGAFSETEIALLKTFADQAVIAIENARLFNETREALEQQTASSQILGVISSSLTDLRPVFDAILESATRLCDAHLGVLNLFEGDMCRTLAQRGGSPEFAKWVLERGAFKPAAAMARVLAERKPFHVPDAREGPGFKAGNENAMKFVELGGVRTYLAVPLLKEGAVIGSINIFRPDVRPFTDTQIALVSTFANQAVIAIENARLFNETKEALEQQTATAEILKVISRSPTDVQPVFDAIAESALRIFRGMDVGVGFLEDDAIQIRAGTLSAPGKATGPRIPLNRETYAGRAVLDAAEFNVADTEAAGAPPLTRERARLAGWRAIALVPMLREGVPIGHISVHRAEPVALDDKQFALLRTFAAQAVIAIENVRLFNETKEALEQQTATAEILKVISGSPTDEQPVFDAIVSTASRLFGRRSRIRVVEGDVLRLRASSDRPGVRELDEEPLPITQDSVGGRVALDRAAMQVADTLAGNAPAAARNWGEKSGYRAIAAAPLMRAETLLGVLSVTSSEPGALSEKQMSLLTTFANQAVIAIENARLFNETTESLEQQTAISEVLRVISSSPADIKPVLEVVASRAAHICDATDARIFVVEGDFMRHASGFGDVPVRTDLVPITRASTSGRAVIDRAPVHVPDIEAESPDEFDHQIARRSGWRSALAVPLMRETRALGAIVLRRREVRPFTEKQAALLATFADQAAIAIENVRLFNEIKDSLEQQQASAEVLAAISSSIADTQPVFDKILRSCERLFAGKLVGINLVDPDGLIRLGAYQGPGREELEKLQPFAPGEGSGSGAAILHRRLMQYADAQNGEDTPPATRRGCAAIGVKSVVFAPMIWEERAIGVIFVGRGFAGEFSEKEIALLRTFADQAVIAIQNARLFREIAEKSRQLEEASRHKSQFLASMSHELRTPLNAILGFNEMILGQIYGEVPPDMKEPLEDIQKSGKHLLRLINNVLDLAKIEAGKMELALADYSVHDTVESVRSTLRPLAEAKGLELVVSVPEDIPLAYGDGGRLTQCLMNLAGNSLKFTKEGRVEIAVEAENGHLRYRVSDTGIGIPPDKIPALFSEFKQTDATIASEYGGTGLGLSITKKFVEMHGGRIWVESEHGKGSVFTLEVPLRMMVPA